MCERKLTGWEKKYRKAVGQTTLGDDIGLRIFHFLLVSGKKDVIYGVYDRGLRRISVQ